MAAQMRNPGGVAGARGVDRTGSQDRREDTEAIAIGQAIPGVMLGLASCHAAVAFRETVRVCIAADQAGYAVDAIAVEVVATVANELIAAADRHGHAEAARRFWSGSVA